MLPEHLKESFESKQVVCVEYHGLTDKNEREIFQVSCRTLVSLSGLFMIISYFQRVQLGMALTPAERLQAQSSARVNFIKELIDEYVSNDMNGLGGPHIEWQKERGHTFRRIAEAVYLVDMRLEASATNRTSRSTTSRSMPELKVLERWLMEDDGGAEISKRLSKRMHRAMGIVNTLIDEKKYRGAFGASGGSHKVAPLEVVFVIFLVAKYMDRVALEDLAQWIKRMRRHLREQHDDVRANNRVIKTASEFVESLEGEIESSEEEKVVVKKKPTKKKKVEDSDVEMADVKPRKRRKQESDSEMEDIKPVKRKPRGSRK
jgi:hypothetical protein